MSKVSIIIPVFNTEKYLERCLVSLVNQTLKDIEIIIVNDGSTDNSLQIAQRFQDNDSRVKIINQQNLKQGAARNNGIKNANGEYIGFVDSDDWVDFGYYEKLYETAKNYEADIALATNVRVGGRKTKKRLNITGIEVFKDLQGKLDVNQQWKNECPTNKIYKRKMLLDNEIFFPEHVYCEDKIFTLKAVYYANKVVTVPNVNYYYFRNPKSTVNTKTTQHLKKLIEDKNNARREVLNFLKEKNAPVRDGDFWAPIVEKRIFGVVYFRKEESLKAVRTKILGFKFNG